MKKLSITSVFLFLIGITYNQSVQAHSTVPTWATVADSVGVEKKDGKRFILHRVDKNQTLYSIARRYGRSLADIQANNSNLKGAVKPGQVIRIPVPNGALSRKNEKAVDKVSQKQEKVEKKVAKVNPRADERDTKKGDDPARAGIHVVESGQTLYSLASRYGVSQSDMRKWNNLPGNNVLIGQALIVSEKAYQVRTPSAPNVAARTPDPSPRTVVVHPIEPRSKTPAAEPHATENRESRSTSSESKSERRTDRDSEPNDAAPRSRNETEVASRPSTTAPTSDNRPSTSAKPAETESEVESPRPGNDAPMPTHGRRISDSGVAEMIEGTDGSGKYLALHRTAPMGTLVQVRNEFNNQSLWVKVIGRLPNTGINDKILIKLSTQAFSKLSPEDRRFRAEVSYIIR